MKGLQEFTKKLVEDEAFAKGFEGITSKEELLMKIKEAGFEVTEEELKGLATEGEVSDDALNDVAGGSFWTSTIEFFQRSREEFERGFEKNN